MKNRWAHNKPAESVEWPTPPELYEALDREFQFDFDPCPFMGRNDGLSRLFMPWYGTWCNTCGWVDPNSLFLIGEGMLKVPPGKARGFKTFSAQQKDGGGMGLVVSGMPPGRGHEPHETTEGASSGTPPSARAKTAIQPINKGAGGQAAAIGDAKPPEAATLFDGSVSVDGNGVAGVSDCLGDDVRLLRTAREADPGPLYPASGSSLPGDGSSQHGPSLSQLQHEQAKPRSVRMVPGQVTPCPYCGLPSRYKGYRCYSNPPYGPGLDEWLQRGQDADLAVFLIPARTDTRWFHRLVLGYAAEIRFIQGRLKFGKAQSPAPFASMLVIFDRPPLPGQMRMPPILTSMKAPNAPLQLGSIPATVARNGRGNH